MTDFLKQVNTIKMKKAIVEKLMNRYGGTFDVNSVEIIGGAECKESDGLHTLVAAYRGYRTCYYTVVGNIEMCRIDHAEIMTDENHAVLTTCTAWEAILVHADKYGLVRAMNDFDYTQYVDPDSKHHQNYVHFKKEVQYGENAQ